MWYHEVWVYWMLGIHDFLLLHHCFYDAIFCADFGGGGCAGNDTLGTDTVSETTLGASAGWGTTTINCGFNYVGNVG